MPAFGWRGAPAARRDAPTRKASVREPPVNARICGSTGLSGDKLRIDARGSRLAFRTERLWLDHGAPHARFACRNPTGRRLRRTTWDFWTNFADNPNTSTPTPLSDWKASPRLTPP